jgi:superfamily II DNA or RNA helicase
MTKGTTGKTQLTLKDRLSRLTYSQASKLLGPEGGKVIQRGGRYDININEDVYLADDLLRIKFPDAVVTMVVRSDRPQRLGWNCTGCDDVCEHVGAALSLVLEEKTALGLAKLPSEREVVESLGEEELVRRALEERSQRAHEEKMKIESVDSKTLWTDYLVTSGESGKTYRVALRGWQAGESFCSCPDFRKNTLGICKHILKVHAWAKRRFSSEMCKRSYQPKELAVYLHYGRELELRMLCPTQLSPELETIIRPFRDRSLDDIHCLLDGIRKLEALGNSVTVYPDAEEFINRRLFQKRMETKVAEIRKNPKQHPLRKELLKTELLPYQLEGIAFCAGAGRAILADDMGLGKTIQGVGVAEFLARETELRKVLVVCPASVKSQWRNEIHRFSHRSCQIVLGEMKTRAEQYNNDCFFTICNYEQVLRDFLAVEKVKWDLIVLDEGQRIKNWETQTSRILKSMQSPFALVLTGTPLENRLDELYSVVEFIDNRRLGPAFRFMNQHKVVDEKGKVLGYKNLGELRENLKPVLLRRTRGSVMQELPERSTEIVRIIPTGEQLEIHQTQMRIVSSIVRKKYISEMDLLRLQKALLMCRMAADSTFLVDKQTPSYSSKLDRLEELLDELARETDRKTLLFSEWTTMLNLIEPMLIKRGLEFVRLDGSVPQNKRQQLVHRFQHDPACKFFITTNAGSTGLNLQAANTVINVDLPWNPAILEQRIGRAHRMGQKRSVQIYLLITEQTIEENLLVTLSGKHELALAALDVNSQVDAVKLSGGIEELKRRLEVLLGAKPDAPVDESEKNRQVKEAEQLQRKENIALAGGQMLTSIFSFLGQLAGTIPASDQHNQITQTVRNRLAECLEKDEKGQFKLTVTLPDPSVLDALANSVAGLMSLK